MALTGCLASYGQGCGGGLQVPEEGYSLGPWVKIEFEGTGSTITVGNESSPATNPPHVACIKSFEFGYSDGLTCRVTIHDEEGGSFVQFMHNLLKNYVCLEQGTPAAVRMKVRFGWAKAGCPDPIPGKVSPEFYCLSDSVETNYSGGKFMFEITGKDTCYRMFEGNTNQTYGGTGTEAIPITQAIREYMTGSYSPNIGSVQFYRMEGGGPQVVPFKFGGVEGPRGKYIASGQNKLQTVKRWLDGHPTDRDKGWLLQYNALVPNGELICWEDSKPTNPQGDAHWDANCIGTYVVNGGKDSPVIEFNPKIKWDFARLTSVGGQIGPSTVNGTGEPGAAQPGRTESGLPRQQQEGAGHTTQATSTETHRDIYGSRETQEVIRGNNAAARSLKILTDNIEADLVIVGNPTILPPSEAMWAKNVTVILVNPYFLRRNDQNNLDWLAQPVCNEILSNKAWICKSVSHKIEAGSYTTTIGLFLTTPGSDSAPETPLGNWTRGWVPRPCS